MQVPVCGAGRGLDCDDGFVVIAMLLWMFWSLLWLLATPQAGAMERSPLEWALTIPRPPSAQPPSRCSKIKRYINKFTIHAQGPVVVIANMVTKMFTKMITRMVTKMFTNSVTKLCTKICYKKSDHFCIENHRGKCKFGHGLGIAFNMFVGPFWEILSTAPSAQFWNQMSYLQECLLGQCSTGLLSDARKAWGLGVTKKSETTMSKLSNGSTDAKAACELDHSLGVGGSLFLATPLRGLVFCAK